MSLLRPDIDELPRYSSSRAEFAGVAEVSLDANENPFPRAGGLNRYPNGKYSGLKRTLSDLGGFPKDNLFLGSGSDECIDVLLKATTIPGQGSIIVFPPTYSMYEVQAKVLGLTCIEWKREVDFSIDVDRFISANISGNLIVICSPNNPTGNTVPPEDIKKLAVAFPRTLIVIDEAYIEFSDKGSLLPLIAEFPNIAIIRTLSKAMGLAGLRVGYLLAAKEIIDACNKVRLPYNLSSVTEKIAQRFLKEGERIKQQILLLKKEREILAKELTKNSLVKRVFPSDANFLLLLVEDANFCRTELLKCGIVVRDRSDDYLCADCIRITIGTPAENIQLIESLKKIAVKYPQRERNTFSFNNKRENSDISSTVVFNERVLFSPDPSSMEELVLNPGALKSLLLLADDHKFRLLLSSDESEIEVGEKSNSNKGMISYILSLLATQGIHIKRVATHEEPVDTERFLMISKRERAELSPDGNKKFSKSDEYLAITTHDELCVYQAESLYEALLFISKNAPDVTISRKTKETDITCTLNLWGNGEVQVKTGIGFFDHMLCQMGFYGKLRLTIAALGDLEIDEHHTIEDVALVLGSAFDKGLGARGGIRRYGFSVPMDEAICSSIIDLSGRAELVWNVQFKRERLGDMPTEMIKHFFKSFANAAKVTLHISASGENEHHIAESIFKAFGQSLRGALRFDPLAIIPSTKGVL